MWALAIILCQLLTGAHPLMFEGQSRTDAQWCTFLPRLTQREIESRVRHLGNRISNELGESLAQACQRLLHACLRREAEERPTAIEFVQMSKELLDDARARERASKEACSHPRPRRFPRFLDLVLLLVFLGIAAAIVYFQEFEMRHDKLRRTPVRLH